MTIGIDFDDSKGVAGVNATTHALDSLIDKLGQLKGAGKSLEEMRKIVVGIKGQGSVFKELADSVKGLNNAAETLRSGFNSSIAGLASIFKNEMTGLRAEVGNLKDTMLAGGRDAGKSFDDGLKKGIKEAVKTAEDGAAKIAKAAKKEIVGEYSPYNAQTARTNTLTKTLAAEAKLFEGARSQQAQRTAKWDAIEIKQQADKNTQLNSMWDSRDTDIKTAAKALGQQVAKEMAMDKERVDAALAREKSQAKQMKGLYEDQIREAKRFADEKERASKAPKAKEALIGGEYSPYNAQTATASFLKSVENDTKASYRSMYAYKIGEAKKAAAVETALLKASVADATMAADGLYSRLNNRKVVTSPLMNAQKQASPLGIDTSVVGGAFTNYDAKRIKKLTDDILVVDQTELRRMKAQMKASRMGLDIDSVMGDFISYDAVKIRNRLKRQADQIITADKTELERMKAMHKASSMGMDTSTVGGAFSAYDAMKKLSPAEMSKLGGAFQKLTIDGNNVHSMARGLASGFNLLWLTWGNLLPLFAGAGVSFGLKKTFDIGSEVEYQIKMMETLGQTTKSEGSVVRQALREIDQTTQFSLVELSQAMVRLGQAGLAPRDALLTLKPAADLASVGMVDLKTSTDLIIQTTALYGKKAGDAGLIAAQLFHITKSGVLNVEDLSGSMKYASEINTRFGTSLEDSLVMLGALAKANLKGPSGGTAMINFMRDLAGRSGPAVKAMKQLEQATGSTIEVFDKAGKQRSPIKIFDDIAKASAKLAPKDADKILAKIFSDRGGRTFFAMVRDGTIDLEKMQAEMKNVKPEELFDAAKGLMDTTKGALDVLKGALVGSLDQVFEAHADKFKTFIKDITAAISSDEFKVSVYGMVQSVMTIYDAIKFLMPALVTLGGAWAVFKVAGGGIAIFQALGMALAGVVPAVRAMTLSFGVSGATLLGTAAAARATAAGLDATAVSAARAGASAAAASGGMRLMAMAVGILSNPIVGIISTLVILGGSWWLATKDAEGAMGAATSAVLKNGSVNIEQWNKEIAVLRDRNKLLGLGKYGTSELTISQAEAEQKKFGSQRQELVRDYNTSKTSGMREAANQALTVYDSEVVRRQKDINQMKTDLSKLKVQQETEEAVSSQMSTDKAEKAAKAAAKAAKEQLKVDGGIPGKGNDPFNKEEKAGINYQLEEIRRISGEKVDAFTNAEKLMEASRTNGYIGDKEYYAKKMKLVGDIAREQESALEQEIAARKSATFGGMNAKADKLTNDAEITKTEAKLAKTHTDNTTNLAILAGQADESFQKIILGYKSAQRAAQEFLDTQIRGNNRELAGYGMGTSGRDATAGRDSIGDKFRDQVTALENAKSDLESQRTGLYDTKFTDEAREKYETELALAKSSYSKQLSLYEQHLVDKRNKEKDWSLGQSEAINNYRSEAANAYKQVESLSTKAFQGMEDAMVSFVTTGKADFKSLAASIISDIVRIIIKQQLSNAMGVAGSGGGGGLLGTIFKTVLGAGLGAATGGASGFATGAGTMGELTSLGVFAKGGVVDSASLSAYSGQVVSSPTTFAFANGAGLMGEAGPEAILPLKRGGDGKLGVSVSGESGSGGGVVVNVTVDATGSKVESNEQTSSQLGAMIGNAVRSVLINEKRPGGILA